MADKQMSVHVTISAADQASPKIKSAVESLNGLEGALRKAQASSEQFRSKWDATFAATSAVGGKMQIAGAALLGLGGIAVKTASDFGEMSQMAGEVFKGQTEAATAWADATGEALNRSGADLLQYAAGFQGLFTPMGIARSEATQMSEAVAQLAVDLGSFWNKQEPDVVRDLASAFAGETESMRKYGVFLSDAALDQELFNAGIRGGSTAATEAEKAHARMAIIMRATKDAQGDAARTAGSLENQIKGLQAELKEAAIATGQALVPALEELAPIAKEALEDLTEFLRTPAGEAFVKWAAGLALVGVTGGTAVKHLGDIAFGAVQIGSLSKSIWERFGGGAKKAADATKEVSEAVEKTAGKTGKLGSVMGALAFPAAIAIGVWAYHEAVSAAIEATENLNKTLSDISAGKGSADLDKWTKDLRAAAAAAREADNAAARSGARSDAPTGPATPMDRDREAEANFEASLRRLREEQAAAKRRMEEAKRGSAEYLQAKADMLEAHLQELAVQQQRLERVPLSLPPPRTIEKAYAEQQERAQTSRDIKREADIYASALDRTTKALQALNAEQEHSAGVTKAQTKANEDAVKAADSYADAQDAAAKATADVAEAVENANKRVREAAEGQTAAWRDAAERIVDAQQAVADAVEDGAERVEDAQKRVADATKAAADAEVDTAEQIIDLNDSLADARERAEDAAKALAKTEKDVADERVKIEKDAAEKIEDIRKSSADKLKSLGEKLQELQAKLRGDQEGGAANVFNIGGRMVMVSDKDAERIRDRLKIMQDIRAVQADITKAKADEAAKVKETRDAEQKRLDEWAEKSPERLGQARESRDDANYALSKAERRIPRQIAQAEERLADAHQAVADAEESLADAREDAARRIAESEKALAKAKEAATKAINDAEEKRLDAEAARAKTFASISEKLEQVAEKLGLAWMKLDETGRASTLGIPGAMATAAGQHQRAMDIGRQIAGGLTAPDVAQSMTAFSGLNVGAPGVASGGGRYGVAAGSVAGAAHVVIGLEPGLVARQLQQDPARGVVVQIARATTAKAPAAGKW